MQLMWFRWQRINVKLGSLRRVPQILGWGPMVLAMEIRRTLVMNRYRVPAFFTNFSGRINIFTGKIHHTASKISTAIRR